jgi:hypothetical protein
MIDGELLRLKGAMRRAERGVSVARIARWEAVAMIVLGLILIAVAVAVGFGVAVSSGDEATLEVFGTDVGVTVAGVFFIGAVLAAALLLGLWLVRAGLGRGHRRRKEVKELRHQAEATPTAPTAPPGDAADGGTAPKSHEGDRQNS